MLADLDMSPIDNEANAPVAKEPAAVAPSASPVVSLHMCRAAECLKNVLLINLHLVLNNIEIYT